MEDLVDLKFDIKDSLKICENYLSGNNKITEKEIEKILSLDNLDDKEKIENFCINMELKDEDKLLEEQDEFQKNIKNFLNNNSKKNYNKKLEKTKEILEDMKKSISDFNNNLPESMKPKGIKSIFFNVKKESELIIVRYSKMITEISKNEKELISEKIKILKEATKLYKVFEKNFNNLEFLIKFILINEKRLEFLEKQLTNKKLSIETVENYNERVKVIEEKLKDSKILILELFNFINKIKFIESNLNDIGKDVQILLSKKLLDWKKEIILSFEVTENSSKSELENQEAEIDLGLIKNLNINLIKFLEKTINSCDFLS